MSSRIHAPKLIVEDNYKVISKHVALRISRVIKEEARKRRRPVIGLATGSSPLGVYRELVRMYRDKSINFDDCVFFNLDEYYGLSRDALQSYNRFMKENFFDHIGAREDQTNIPDGAVNVSELKERCESYERRIRAFGGIDFQILGIGRDGHIGFNEPGSSIDSRTRLVSLSDVTRRDAAPDFFGLKNVPTEAITMGVGTILEAKEIVLLVSGEHKAPILRDALERPPSAEVPASYLQYHNSVEVLTDGAGASKLTSFTTPWLVRKVDWEDELEVSQAAVIWLAIQRKKTIENLDSSDFYSEGLGSMYETLGPLFTKKISQNLSSKISRLFNLLQALVVKQDPKGNRKILILSPHPDDDVICTGALMEKLANSGHELQVAYMVSGSNAVRDEDVLNYLALKNSPAMNLLTEWASLNGIESEDDAISFVKNSIYSKKRGVADHHIVRQIKAEIRRQEAIRASSKAHAQAHFLNLPFYEEYGTARKAPISDEDVEIIKQFLESLMPDVIFVAGDTTDPNGTHSMCLTAFEEAMRDLSKKSYAPKLFQYRGAWEEFSLEESFSIEPFDDKSLNQKIETILEHVSQIDPLFPGPSDDRQFWERVRDRNKASVELMRKLGLSVPPNSIGAELYKEFSLSKN